MSIPKKQEKQKSNRVMTSITKKVKRKHKGELGRTFTLFRDRLKDARNIKSLTVWKTKIELKSEVLENPYCTRQEKIEFCKFLLEGMLDKIENREHMKTKLVDE